MLLVRGPDNTYSPFAQLLLYNVRHLAVVFGLADRKRVAFADPTWKKCMAITSSLMTDLTDLLVSGKEAVTSELNLTSQSQACVPSLLQECDAFRIVRKRGRRRPMDVLVDLCTLERDLHAWQLVWLRSFHGLPYWTTDVSDFDHFHKYHPEADQVFPKAYVFQSFSSASAQMSYWIALLHIKRMISQVGQLEGPRSIYAIQGRCNTLVEEADECAQDLCRSVAWLIQPTYGSCGIIRASSPIRYAARWFIAQANLERTQWCLTVERNLGSSGIVFHSQEDFLPNMSDGYEPFSDDSSSPP